MTIREALAEGAKRLEEAGVDGGRDEAEYLLGHVLGRKRHELFLDAEAGLTDAEACRFSEFVRRRAGHEPPQYITGEAGFMGLTFMVTPETLIPRPETELVVEECLALSKEAGQKGPVVIDLCTGSGCVAVAIAHALPKARVYATDVSAGAVNVAGENAKENGVKVTFAVGDLYAALKGFKLEGQADFIVTNPPYVTDADYEGLAPEIRLHEPAGALRAGADGLDVIRRIIAGAGAYLKPGGTLLLEIGYDQAGAVRGLTEEAGIFRHVELKKDLGGIERVLVARR